MSRRGNAKNLKESPISVEDITNYASSQSDFAFEMEILQLCRQHCFGQTSWGGFYFDPNTGKQREYDIRTELPTSQYDCNNWVELAIECKNLKSNFPIVISCTPRIEREQTVDYWHWCPRTQPTEFDLGGRMKLPNIDLLDIAHYERQSSALTLFYPLNGFVGRSLDQVGIDEKDASFITDDSSTFDKWTQSLGSLHGMLEDVFSCNDPKDHHNVVFLPVVVVPDGTLWQINYSVDGKMENVPKQVDSISYWIDVEYFIDLGFRKASYNVSHLHFFTKSGLVKFLQNKIFLREAFHAF